jgi:S-DNA-T family DNA segregation ATPase FtsK/SpoIIIE
MPPIGNQFRNSNSFRDEPKSKPAPKQTRSAGKTEVLPPFNLNNDRAIKIIGLFFLIVSLYLWWHLLPIYLLGKMIKAMF